MEIEEVAKIDFYLKNNKENNNILDIEDLILIDTDSSHVKSFKDAAYRLAQLKKDEENIELYSTWKNLFTKQVKYSVQLVKEKTEKN